MVSAYNDLDRPPLDERSLQRALMVPDGFVSALRVLPTVESTNTALVAAAKDGAPHASVVVAEEQTAGRGRLGRTWTAPPRSGLFVSILLRPEVPLGAWTWLPLLAGVAAREAVARTAKLEIALKWPNDLVVAEGEQQDRKLGGILCETIPGEDAIVAGIGLNVTLREQELPVPQASSLALAGAESTDRDPLLRSLLRSFGTWYGRWSDAGGDAHAAGLADAYRDACATIGRRVRAELPGHDDVIGVATGLDAAGALLVTTSDQGEVAVGAGDVVHLRPEDAN
ncbi:biotin--[acetyl-CoA-carboxylase] ligase [Actinospica durhamensis]|uniref:biotin--[biotin carboxyl-carrier protein] ligase n=1 Tax=Actinospica durhamensis TaxID=1508375 RepID=A0A941ENP3_9ACTN|nr:biotin--[acetyl-CoA-carboxylase] ligase [Actinospica durhamensis]MBR7835052.1 biotin--[acetyl-CoA-carboxylase] ligase [Actinospica durhamensis]